MKHVTYILGLVLVLTGGVASGISRQQAHEFLTALPYNGVIAVTADVQVKPGQVEAFKALLPQLQRDVASEEGNILVAMAQSLEDPTRFRFYGEWGHRSQFVDHMSAPHSRKFLEKTKDILVAPPDLTFAKR